MFDFGFFNFIFIITRHPELVSGPHRTGIRHIPIGYLLSKWGAEINSA
jgi:hypothetical protein